MTMSDYRGIVEFLRRNFPNAKKYKDRDTMNDGWLLVKDMDAQTVMGNAVEFMQTYPYPPDIKEIAAVKAEAKIKMAPVTVDENVTPPCMIVHKYGGDIDNPSGLTVGELIAKYYPCAECDGCERNQIQSCYGLIFGGRGNG